MKSLKFPTRSENAVPRSIPVRKRTVASSTVTDSVLIMPTSEERSLCSQVPEKGEQVWQSSIFQHGMTLCTTLNKLVYDRTNRTKAICSFVIHAKMHISTYTEESVAL